MTLRSKISANLHKLMIWPAIFLFTVFFIIPFFSGVGISLTDWNGFTTPDFIGLGNFARFFQDERALNALRITILLVWSPRF